MRKQQDGTWWAGLCGVCREVRTVAVKVGQTSLHWKGMGDQWTNRRVRTCLGSANQSLYAFAKFEYKIMHRANHWSLLGHHWCVQAGHTPT